MNIKRYFWFALGGALLCAALRFADFYLYFDGTFLTDNGLLSAIGVGVVAVLALLFLFVSFKNKNLCFEYTPSASILRGVAALSVSLASLAAAFYMYEEYRLRGAMGLKEFSATGLSMRVPFMVVTAVLCLYMLFAAILHVTGKEQVFAKAKLMELIPVLWGLVYILYVFIHYSVSFIITENAFIIFSACTLTLALIGKAKYLSAVDIKGKAFNRFLITGTVAAMLSIGYVLSNLVLLLFGKGFAGELSVPVQLVLLTLGVNCLLFLGSSRNVPTRQRENEPRHAR